MARVPETYLRERDPLFDTVERQVIAASGNTGRQAGAAVVVGAALAAVDRPDSWPLTFLLFLLLGVLLYAAFHWLEHWFRYYFVAPVEILQRRLSEAHKTIRRFSHPELLGLLADDLHRASALSVRPVTTDEQMDLLHADYRQWMTDTKRHIALRSKPAAARFTAAVTIKGGYASAYNDQHRTIWIALKIRQEKLSTLIEKWEDDYGSGAWDQS